MIAIAEKRVRVNPDGNRLLEEDYPAHNWYRFILSYPPTLVRQYLERFGVGAGDRVCDPFLGTGTTLVECKRLGIPSVGVEGNAITHFASRVKVDWSMCPETLLSHAKAIAAATEQAIATASKLRTLPPDVASLLIRGSISPLPLHKVLLLLEQIDKRPETHATQYERLALAKALVSGISNLRFGPEVGVGKIKDDAPVIQLWLQGVRTIAQDLKRLRWNQTPAEVILGDARRLLNVLEPRSIDALVCSPSYPCEKSYSRVTRLESVILGFVQTKDDRQAVNRALLRSHSRSVYCGDDDDRWIDGFQSILSLADTIEAKRVALGKTSGFERQYANVTRQYFGGMARHLAELRPALKPGANLAYVVGDQCSFLNVHIHTGQLLAEIAASFGYTVVSLDLFRTRAAATTKMELREEVLVLRWDGD